MKFLIRDDQIDNLREVAKYLDKNLKQGAATIITSTCDHVENHPACTECER